MMKLKLPNLSKRAFEVAQVSEPAVSPTSKSAAREQTCGSQVWKPATQQTWKSAPRTTRAFTLIEVLLAVAIFAVVLAAINTVFFGALHLRMTTSRSLDASLPLEQALTLLRRDLQGAMPPGTNGDLIGDFKSGDAANGFGMTQNGGLEFYTSTGVINDDAPWGDIQRVFYQLRDPANRTASPGKDLIRGVTRNLLATTMEDPVEQRLLGDVETLEFACYNGTDWRDSWDTSMGDSGLPQAVRVRIFLAANNTGNARNRQPIEMLVPVESQARTNQTSGGVQ